MNHISNLDVPNILDKVVSTKPLIYHMTNMVAMEEQAHLSLAIGASPVMSLFPEEAAQMVTIANAILINIGTPSKEANETMLIAARTARNLGKPAILDPVGYGATKARIDFVETLLETGAFTIIKGNGAEISLLAGERAEVRGVDSVGSPLAAIAARKVAARYNCVAAATGPVDYVSDGTKVYSLKSGHEWLTKVSGSGCWVGTLMAACASVADPLPAAMAALSIMGAASEEAAKRSKGPGTFRINMFDVVYEITSKPHNFKFSEWKTLEEE
ncbi:MAG: hydroxyethylthiazole kinase [Coprothermobacter proteolyticus]